MKASSRFFLLGLISALSAAAQAGPVGPLTSFTANTTAKAAEVNTNFTAVKAAVDDNDGRITTNAAGIAANTTGVAANTAAIATNAAGVLANAANIATNASGIAANAAGIAANSASIATNTAGLHEKSSLELPMPDGVTTTRLFRIRKPVDYSSGAWQIRLLFFGCAGQTVQWAYFIHAFTIGQNGVGIRTDVIANVTPLPFSLGQTPLTEVVLTDASFGDLEEVIFSRNGAADACNATARLASVSVQYPTLAGTRSVEIPVMSLATQTF